MYICHQARRRDYEWNEHTCTRLAKRATKDPTRNAHRIEVTVTGLPSRESKEVVAFDGPTSDYTLTGSQAEEKLGHIKEGRGPCWVKRSDESRVSISEVDDDPEAVSRGRRALYIAWTTTFLAAVFGMMTLILGSHWIGDLGHQGDTQEEEEKAKGMLNREQAKFVCERFSSDSKAEEGGWTCSVCLDGSAEEGRTALVNLPCEHRFHMQYVDNEGVMLFVLFRAGEMLTLVSVRLFRICADVLRSGCGEVRARVRSASGMLERCLTWTGSRRQREWGRTQNGKRRSISKAGKLRQTPGEAKVFRLCLLVAVCWGIVGPKRHGVKKQ